MSEEKSFWTTMPGILTGIAAVITALGGLIFGLYQAGIISKPPEVQEQFSITIGVDGNGTTNPSPGEYLYDEGTRVSIRAIPDPDHELNYWSGGHGSSSTLDITVSRDMSITAYFKPVTKEQFFITIGVDGNGTTNPSPGTYPYDEGSRVSIRAIPDPGYELDYWSGGYGTSSTLDITVSRDMSITAYFKPVTVVFVDSNLEATIRETLNKHTGPIYASDLASMTKLEAIDKGISDLSGLEFCVNLEELSLWQNNISIISPLAGLVNLKKLALAQNNIINIDPLAGLTNLEWLSLWENHVKDISALAGLRNLHTLRMWKNQVSDISSLANLKKLEDLSLADNRITNIDSLAGLTNLNTLYLNGNQISDIEALIRNTGLSTGDLIDLRDLPLNSTSLNSYIPTLQRRGVEVVR